MKDATSTSSDAAGATDALSSLNSWGKISVVKVPGYLAKRWVNSPNKSTLGMYIVDEKEGTNRIVVDDGGESPGWEFTEKRARQDCCVCIMKTQEKSEDEAQFLAQIDKLSSFVPSSDKEYFEFMKSKRLKLTGNTTKLLPESSDPQDMLRNQMLFRYLQPKPVTTGSNGSTESGSKYLNLDTGFAKGRFKVKRSITMEENQMKMRLFQMFQNAGDEGLQLKQVVLETNQPLRYVKNALDEIAEQRKRASDRKTVYFLRDHFSSSSGGKPSE